MRFNIQAQTPTKACKRRKAKRVIPHGPPTASRQPPTNRAQPELYGQLQCLLPFLTNTLSLRIFSLSISLYLSLSRSTPLHLSLSSLPISFPASCVARIHNRRNGCRSRCLGPEARGSWPLLSVRLRRCCLLFRHSRCLHASRCVGCPSVSAPRASPRVFVTY